MKKILSILISGVMFFNISSLNFVSANNSDEILKQVKSHEQRFKIDSEERLNFEDLNECSVKSLGLSVFNILISELILNTDFEYKDEAQVVYNLYLMEGNVEKLISEMKKKNSDIQKVNLYAGLTLKNIMDFLDLLSGKNQIKKELKQEIIDDGAKYLIKLISEAEYDPYYLVYKIFLYVLEGGIAFSDEDISAILNSLVDLFREYLMEDLIRNLITSGKDLKYYKIGLSSLLEIGLHINKCNDLSKELSNYAFLNHFSNLAVQQRTLYLTSLSYLIKNERSSSTIEKDETYNLLIQSVKSCQDLVDRSHPLINELDFFLDDSYKLSKIKSLTKDDLLKKYCYLDPSKHYGIINNLIDKDLNGEYSKNLIQNYSEQLLTLYYHENISNSQYITRDEFKEYIYPFYIELFKYEFGEEFNQYKFYDSEEYKYLDAILYLAEQKIVNGYPDGSFQPDRQLNRAELLKIVLNAAGINKNEFDQCKNATLKDVPQDSWYYGFLCYALKNNIIKGYSDGTFKGEKLVSLVEAAKIIALSFGENSTEDGKIWYENYIRDIEEYIPSEMSQEKNPFEQNISRGILSEIVTAKISPKIKIKRLCGSEEICKNYLNRQKFNFEEVYSKLKTSEICAIELLNYKGEKHKFEFEYNNCSNLKFNIKEIGEYPSFKIMDLEFNPEYSRNYIDPWLEGDFEGEYGPTSYLYLLEETKNYKNKGYELNLLKGKNFERNFFNSNSEYETYLKFKDKFVIEFSFPEDSNPNQDLCFDVCSAPGKYQIILDKNKVDNIYALIKDAINDINTY